MYMLAIFSGNCGGVIYTAGFHFIAHAFSLKQVAHLGMVNIHHAVVYQKIHFAETSSIIIIWGCTLGRFFLGQSLISMSKSILMLIKQNRSRN